MLNRLKAWAHQLKQAIIALYLAYRHPDTPALARIITFLVVAYALSPLDLIPDFVPLFGYLDDVILLPLGIALAVRLIPQDVLAEVRRTAQDTAKPTSFAFMRWVIIFVWLIVAVLVLRGILN